MYRSLVKRRIRGVFEALSRGDASVAVTGLHPKVHHVFAGEHPLGGERHTRDAVERWFARVFRLFELHFDVRTVAAEGWPWDTVVAVEWLAYARPAVGDPYENEGAHIIRLRWGRVVYFHAYEDSQKVAEACRVMAASGVEEAAAAPIAD